MSSIVERHLSHRQASSSQAQTAAKRRMLQTRFGRSFTVSCCASERDTAVSNFSSHTVVAPTTGTSDHTSMYTKVDCPKQKAGDQVITRFIAETLLPTRHGLFRLRGYKHTVDSGVTFTEPTAIICGKVEGQENVAVRVHDACFTSEVLGSLKCDCAEQLQLALEYIQQQPPGLVIYLQQEGRGIGLANKIAAYSLQEQGLDTVDANRALGLPDDCREYTSVRNIISDLKIKSIRLMTNNPRKINELAQLGIIITDRIPCVVEAGAFNQGYLEAKRDRMDHLLDGSWCYWNHDGEPTQPTASAYSRGGMGLPGRGLTGPDGKVIVSPNGAEA